MQAKFFFFQAEDGIRDLYVTGVQTCALPISDGRRTEFWVAEEGSDRIAMRQELETENTPGMESVLSLRTVEFLRVSLGLTGHTVTRPPVGPQIGRASCRERVEISGAGVALNK